MILPVQTTFRNMDRSAALITRIEEEAGKLDRYFDHITSCRVMVEAPHRHHRHGEAFHVRIELGVPGKVLVVTQDPTLHDVSKHDDEGGHRTKRLELNAPHKEVYVALRHAFDAMRRQLQDYVHNLRQEVKTHHPAPHAHVVSLFPEKDHGFIETEDGREIYFHRNSVLNSVFEHLSIGSEVIFNEEAGENGSRASTVRLAGKQHPSGIAEE